MGEGVVRQRRKEKKTELVIQTTAFALQFHIAELLMAVSLSSLRLAVHPKMKTWALMWSPVTLLLDCTKGMKSAVPGTALGVSKHEGTSKPGLPRGVLTPDRGILAVTQINDWGIFVPYSKQWISSLLLPSNFLNKIFTLKIMLFYTLHKLIHTSYMCSQIYLTLLGILRRKTKISSMSHSFPGWSCKSLLLIMQSTPQKCTALSQRGPYDFNLGIIRWNRCECQEYLCLQIPPIMHLMTRKCFMRFKPHPQLMAPS